MEISELSDDTTSCNQFTVDDLDIEILPLIYEIIRSVEKDPFDTTQKAKESQDTSQKIIELQKRFDSVRAQIKRLPGIEYSKEEQLQKLETLRKQLRLKRELLLKYRNSKPMRRAAQFVVYLLSRAGSISGTHKLPSDPKEFAIQLKNIAQKFAQNFKNSIENTKEEMKKK